VAEIKICGLTRAEDAAVAAALGAAYAGVIFAGGPRRRTVAQAAEVFAGLRGSAVRRVGVFGVASAADIAETAAILALDVVQLHAGGDRDAVRNLRERYAGAVWGVIGVDADGAWGDLPWPIDALDAVVLDTSVAGRQGGTGVAFDWVAARPQVAARLTGRRWVLAGGLRPSTVGTAVRTLSPSVVDVSSGVESAPGIKDEELLRAFVQATPRDGAA
jgi:phosphoribosylanthranilate isomerase